MPSFTFKKTLSDDSTLSIEDNGERFIQVRVSKGKTHRSYSFTREEMAALAQVLKLVDLEWRH